MGNDFNGDKASFENDTDVLELDSDGVQTYCTVIQYNSAKPCEYTKILN